MAIWGNSHSFQCFKKGRIYSMRRKWVLMGLLALGGLFCGCGTNKTEVVNTKPRMEIKEVDFNPGTEDNQLVEANPVKEILEKNGYRLDGPKPTVLLVSKRERRMTVYRGTTPIKSYPIVLGRNPKNDKLREGDLCTPEGVYKVVTKRPHQRWSKFILLDYPNQQNWLKFAQAKKEGKISPAANIGNAIGIHGTEDDNKNLRGDNWTRGCISLINQHVDEIYNLINDNTLVVIKKR
jgi:murein L,D-transpeptidase YafK